MRKYGNSSVWAITYLVLPIVIFFLTWLRLYIGIPCAVLLLVGAYKYYESIAGEIKGSGQWHWSKECLTAVILIFVYLLLTGHGNFVGAVGFDVPWRNAIYHDLINEHWPVIYQNSQSALIYYLVYWLVPAGISSILHLDEFASNVVLFAWTFLGLLIFVSNLWEYLQVKSKKLLYVIYVFLFWSGLNTIGMLIMQILNSAKLVEFTFTSGWGWELWWYTGIKYSNYYMIRTVFDSLANIYNQFVPLLLGTILFLRFKTLKNIFFVAMLTLPYSPFGFVGLGFLAVGETVGQLVLAKKNNMENQDTVFTRQNLLAIVTILPVFALYFFSNSMSGNTGGSITKLATASAYNAFVLKIFVLVLYYVLQFGVFMALCYKNNKGKPLFWLILLSLSLFPLIKLGNSSDFGWNGSIPAFFMLMVMVIQELFSFQERHRLFRKHGIILFVAVCLAATTPILQMGFSVHKCLRHDANLVSYYHDGLDSNTLSDKDRAKIGKEFKNFANIEYKDKAFYKYVAKD